VGGVETAEGAASGWKKGMTATREISSFAVVGTVVVESSRTADGQSREVSQQSRQFATAQNER
jgi:hypothetical protein